LAAPQNPTFPLESVDRCPLCESSSRREVACAEDSRFGYPGKFPVFECKACRMLYLGERVEEHYLPQLYSAYYRTSSVLPSSGNSRVKSTMKNRLRSLHPDTLVFRDLQKYRSILEIGPGMRPVHDRHGWKGEQYLAVEYDDKALVALRARFGDDSVFDSLSKVGLPRREAPPECCVADQVLEHLYDPVGFLTDVRKVISGPGSIIVATPNGDSRFRDAYGNQWIGWHVPYHAMLYSARSLAVLAERCDLEIKTLRTFTPGSWARLQISSVGGKCSLIDLASVRIGDIAGGGWHRNGDNLYCVFETRRAGRL